MAAAELFTEFAATGAQEVIRDAVKIQASIEKQAKETNKSLDASNKAADSAYKNSYKWLSQSLALADVEKEAKEVAAAMAKLGMENRKLTDDNAVEVALALGKVEDEARESAEALAAVEAEMKKIDKEDALAALAQDLKTANREAYTLEKTSKGAKTELAKIGASKAFPQLTRKIKVSRDMISLLSEKFKGLGNIAQIAIAGVAVAAFAALAAAALIVVTTVKKIYTQLKAAWPQAKKFQKTLSIMKTTFADIEGSSDKISFDSAIKQMEELYKVTLFTKEEILRVQAAVGRTSRDPEVFKQATQAALNLAAAKPEMSVPAASQWITTLLGDPSRTMDKFRRAEIQVSKGFQKAMEQLLKEGKLVEAQLLTIAQLTQRFAGAAENVRFTDAGELEMVQKAWADIFREGSEMFAHDFVPAAQKLTQTFIEHKDTYVDMLRDVSVVTKEIAGYTADMAGYVTLSIKGAKWLRDRNVQKRSDSLAESAVKKFTTAMDKALKIYINPVGALAKRLSFIIEHRTGGFDPVVADIKLGKEKNKNEEEREREYKKQIKYAKAATEFIEEEKVRLDELEAKKKEAAKVEKANQDEYIRSLKRVQVYIRDQATHWERYREQLKKIKDLREKAEVAGKGGRSLDIYLDQIQRRLFKTAMDAQNKPARDAAAKKIKDEASRKSQLNTLMEKFLKRDDKLREFALAFERIAKGAGFDPKKRLEALTAISSLVGEIVDPKDKKKRDEGFRSSSVALSGLYEAINASVQQRDPVEDAIDKQTIIQQKNAARLRGKMDTVIKVIGGPKPAIAGGTP